MTDGPGGEPPDPSLTLPGSVAGALDPNRMRRLLDIGASLVEELDRILAGARELTAARYAALGVLDESQTKLDRFITAGLEARERKLIGDLPTGKGVLGYLIDVPMPLRLTDVSRHPQAAGFPENHPPMSTFLGVPIVIGGTPFGNLYLTEKSEGREFDETDEAAAVVLAAWAAIAIRNAQSIAADRVRQGIAAAERERAHWARELHDETLQGLGAVRVMLASGLRSGSGERLASAAEEVIGRLEQEITSLRRLISELRPAALDELGLAAALETLVEERATAGFEVRSRIELNDGPAAGRRLDPDTELTIYRVVQEALTNVAKHSRAELVELDVLEAADAIEVVVQDDGIGIQAPDADGFGLAGVRERAGLVGGAIEIETAPGAGTALRLRIPVSVDR